MKITTYGSIFLLGCVWANGACAVSLEYCREQDKKQISIEEKYNCWKSLADPEVSAQPDKAQNQVSQVVAPQKQQVAEEVVRYKPEGVLLSEWIPNSDKRVLTYKQNYLLYAHSSNPNNMPTSPNPNNQVPISLLDNRDLKFQLSGKGMLTCWKWNGKCDETDINSLWLAYTQQSFWQAFDYQNSRPFRENNYAPELIWSHSYPKQDWIGPFKYLRVINAGLVHQSNGQSNPRSRSWNRGYIQAGFEGELGGGRLIVQPKIWARFSEDRATDDNPDINHYLGYGELQIRYANSVDKPKWQLSALARIRSLQLDVDMPLDVIGYVQSDFKAHLQYFTGYGESLLDYNQQHHTWGLGVSLPY